MKRIISLLLTFVVVVMMVPAVAFATDTPVYVAGKNVTTDTYWLNSDDGSITTVVASESNYNLKYTVENNEVHLYIKGLTINCNQNEKAHYSSATYYALYSPGALTIHLEGTNEIKYDGAALTYGDAPVNIVGIATYFSPLTLLGSGSLSITGEGNSVHTCDAINASVVSLGTETEAFTGSLIAQVLESTNAGGTISGSVKVYGGTLIVSNRNYSAISGDLTVTGGTVEAYVSGYKDGECYAINGMLDYSGYQPAPPILRFNEKYNDNIPKENFVSTYDYFKISSKADLGNDGDGADFSYTILEGGNQTIKAGTSMTVRADAPFADFKGVTVDGKAVPKDMLKSWDGSTYVKLSSTYASTLAAGSHAMVLKFSDGEVKTSFTIVEAGAQTSPNTGVNDLIGVWGALVLVAVVSGATLIYSRKQ